MIIGIDIGTTNQGQQSVVAALSLLAEAAPAGQAEIKTTSYQTPTSHSKALLFLLVGVEQPVTG